MKLNLIGNFFGSDGYSNHTRQLANVLNKNCEVSIMTNKPQDWVRHVNDDELKMLNRNPGDSDVNLFIGMPHYWPLYLCENKPFIGFLVWEGDKIPKFWSEYLLDERVKQIWVPSIHVKNAIQNTLGDGEVVSKVKIVPHGVDLSIFQKKEKEDETFRFIANKGYRGSKDRGGLQFLFKAFNEEFKSNEDVELYVKINASYGIIDFNKHFQELGLKNDGGKINISVDNLDFKDMVKLYNMGDVFVTTSQAEAFNLPCLEAMACGLSVITTDFGGQTDYVNEENGWLIKEGVLKEVKHDIMYEGISWKEPDIKEIRKTLRGVYNAKTSGKEKTYEEKASKALETAKQYTWENSAIKAKEFLGELDVKS